MKLTRKRAVKLHRELWNWLADNPKKANGFLAYKWDWPEWKRTGAARSNCFCCEFHTTHKGNYCNENCVIVWPYGGCDEGPKCPFRNWKKAKYANKRSRLAREIANLPAR